MSESREKKRRYNLRLEYISHFSDWLNSEPPMWMFWKWFGAEIVSIFQGMGNTIVRGATTILAALKLL